MLAAKRTAKVPGRIIFLIVSISTIKGIKSVGVPWGTKWANIWCLLFTHLKIIYEIHKGNDKDRVITKWLDLVNTYGIKPKKLLYTIMVKIVTKIIDNLEKFGFSKILNSLWSVWIVLYQIKNQRLGVIQYI